MAEELVPPSVSHDDNLTVVIVPKATLTAPAAPTAAILNSATRVTYSMTADGWNASNSQETETDPRLARRDQGETPGRVTDALETIHVYGSEDDVMDPLVVEGEDIYFVVRYSVPNETAFAAGQTVDVWSVTPGRKRKTITGGKQTKTTKQFVKNLLEDVAVVA